MRPYQQRQIGQQNQQPSMAYKKIEQFQTTCDNDEKAKPPEKNPSR